MIVAGIMTGTSVDAIDIATCDITSKGDRQTISLLSFTSAPFEEETRLLIHRCMRSEADMQDLCDLPFLLAREFAVRFADHCAASGIRPEALAVHGQTLWHHPTVSTWQALAGPALSALTDLPVVHDFRSADVALGGQGAPLVPIYDHAVYADDTLNRVTLNIGGMANMTILPAGVPSSKVVAFDCGPGNVWIDGATRLTYGKSFDTNGAIARAGSVLRPFLAELTSLPYFALDPPKSTGRELFTMQELKRLITKYSHPSSPLEDVVTTLTELTAWSIVDHLRRYASEAGEVIVSGGGSQNTYLIERLSALSAEMDSRCTFRIDTQWAAKEAMAFAYLGWRTLQGLPGNLPSVTGAERDVVLGTIARA
ncbi:MAG: anhydro-N-acetylmuramic acid kinase [Candidatus Kapabacteria bacterium]|nr:anhydro-N-acetylmuramic acid kinase [Candidatus Kapabacteria bacterium]